ncbi:hypothetical protein MIMGU_mgv11b023471mg, partial [Erythranthe guttata]
AETTKTGHFPTSSTVETIIRELNLFPELSKEESSINEPKLVEKRIRFPVLSDKGSNDSSSCLLAVTYCNGIIKEILREAGNLRWVTAMGWYGRKNFELAPSNPFVVDGVKVGIKKNYGSLTFLKVFNAGHMVPMDQPKASLEMLTRWMKGKSL